MRHRFYGRSQIFNLNLTTKSLLASGLCIGSEPPVRSIGHSGGAADRMSALPYDLLLLVLARLGCAASAARTSVLARRWRRLWTHLPAFAFRDVAFRSLEPALAQVSVSSPAVPFRMSLLDVHVPDMPPDGTSVTSLLQAAARLSPEDVVLNLALGLKNRYTDAELPCFHAATSINLDGIFSFVASAAECCFPMLTTLVLSGVIVDGLTDLISRCPCLRVLRFKGGPWARRGHDIMVHSSSLRELVVVDDDTLAQCIDIVTPMLEQLTVSFLYQSNLSLCVSAPKAEKVSWCYDIFYSRGCGLGFGLWNLRKASLTVEAPERSLLRIDGRVKCEVRDPIEMAREVEKHLHMQVAADLSVLDLELHLVPEGHVYGGFVVFILGINRIGSATRRLKVSLFEPLMMECYPDDCPCEPTDWRSQIMPLRKLEEVEIDGFTGCTHEFELLEHILTCAPGLKRVIVKQSPEVKPSDVEIHKMFKAHPFLECCLV